MRIKEREDRDRIAREQLQIAWRPVYDGYMEALNLLPLDHPDRELVRTGCRMAQLTAGLGVLRDVSEPQED